MYIGYIVKLFLFHRFCYALGCDRIHLVHLCFPILKMNGDFTFLLLHLLNIHILSLMKNIRFQQRIEPCFIVDSSNLPVLKVIASLTLFKGFLHGHCNHCMPERCLIYQKMLILKKTQAGTQRGTVCRIVKRRKLLYVRQDGLPCLIKRLFIIEEIIAAVQLL